MINLSKLKPYLAVAVAVLLFGIGVGFKITAARVDAAKARTEVVQARLDASRALVASRDAKINELILVVARQSQAVDSIAAAAASESASRRRWEEDARYWYQRSLKLRAPTKEIACDSIPTVDWSEVLGEK